MPCNRARMSGPTGCSLGRRPSRGDGKREAGGSSCGAAGRKAESEGREAESGKREAGGEKREASAAG